MAYKIDIYHRNKNITFGERFKGEVGKDIFAAKVALGILRPISGAPEIEGAPEFSYDQNIPLDDQKWFDCSTGLGVDLKKATTFDRVLENALLTFQINNQFLITCYYFEKLGFRNLLNSSVNGDTIYQSSILAQIEAAIGIFESELKTLGEATIAILHGWVPGTRPEKNTSYTHDERVFGDEDLEIEFENGETMLIKSEHYPDVIPIVLHDYLLSDNYPQNFEDLVESDIAIPDSLKKFSDLVPPNPRRQPGFSDFSESDRSRTLREYIDLRISENRKWAKFIGESTINFDFAIISYRAKLTGDSPLFNATKKVIDYYLENDLFSQTRTPEQLAELARRATYPDPFVRDDPFVIDNKTIGYYFQTDYFLRAEGPLPPSESDTSNYLETIKLLEEKALIEVLGLSQKPQIWNFFVEDFNFKAAYFSSVDPEISPNHSGIYPMTITRGMKQDLVEAGVNVDFALAPSSAREFRKNNYWVLSTSNITNELEETQASSIEYWRTIDSFGNTEPLIKFKEFITPSLRVGQPYRALFLINKQKFDAITNGDNLQQRQTMVELDASPIEEGPCLNDNSEQAERTYEEYKAHAIKRRRELVREIRQKLQKEKQRGARIDLGAFDDAFAGININSYTDQEMVSKISQLLPLEEVVEVLGEAGSSALDWIEENAIEPFRDPENPDNNPNKLKITVKDLEERIQKVVQDLKEAAKIVAREGIEFNAGSKFDGEAEAIKLQSFLEELKSFYMMRPPGTFLPDDVLIFDFRQQKSDAKIGPKIGKQIYMIKHEPTDSSEYTVAAINDDIRRFLGTNSNLMRPRTVNYVARIKEMTKFPTVSSFFQDARRSCQDLGINFEKLSAKSFLTRFTSGLSLVSEDPEDGFTFSSWWEDEVTDPIKEFGRKSKSNMEKSIDPTNFDRDAALRVFGELCTIEQAWAAFNKLDLASLICDYVKCLKLPPFEFKAPDFRINPFPETPIFGWYLGLIEFLEEEYENIFKRLGCTVAKMLIDKLAFPFCEEQLQEFIQSGLQSPPLVRDAIIESLTNTGVPSSKSAEAKDFYESVSSILTGRELCYLLQGNTPDDATMLAIQRLAVSTGVAVDISTPEEIVNFFGVIGTYFPDEFCEALNEDTTLSPTNCEETNSLLQSIRNRLQSGDGTLSEEEINNAVALAEKNKQEQADRLQALLENGFSGMSPEFFRYGDPNALLSDLPDHLKNEHEKSARSIFTDARAAYISDLSNFVPSMTIEAAIDLFPYDERYNVEQILRLESAMQQLSNYAKIMGSPTDEDGETPQGGSGNRVTPDLIEQYPTLFQLFQTEQIDSLPENLVPETYRENLQKFVDSEGEVRYKVPVSSILKSRRYVPALKDDFVTTNVPGIALVHKRRIKSDQLSLEEINQRIQQLTVLRSNLDDRVSRTGGATRDAIRAQRRPIIARITQLEEARNQLDPDGDGVPTGEVSSPEVSYEFFLEYQQIQRGLLAGEEHPLGLIEFELVPYDVPVYSEEIEFSNYRDPLDLVSLAQRPDSFVASERVIYDNETFSEDYTSRHMLTGNPNEQRISDAVNEITSRTKLLGDKIIKIMQETNVITDSVLLPGLQKMLSRVNEKNLEKLNRESETVSSAEPNVYEIKFNVGSIYSPSVRMIEIPANSDKDRFDIEIEGDYYLGLPLQSNTEPAGIKKFRFCDPVNAGQYSLPNTPENQPTFGKRNVFKNILARSLSVADVNFTEESDLSNFIKNQLFRKVTESVIEILLDSMSESRIFNSSYANELDKRVSGRRIIKSNCVSNRFSFGDGSVVSFDKAITDNFQQELAKELSKPENAPENSDFDSPGPFQYAVQNMAIRGFIRSCLIDSLLKGAVSFAVWDIESVIGSPIYINYITSHIRHQLDSNSDFSSSWGLSLERTTGISNKSMALESIIKEEIVKLPNYSKQVYHPDSQGVDFSRWFQTQKIDHFEVLRFDATRVQINPDNNPNFDPAERGSVEKLFIIEHYFSIKGVELVAASKNALTQTPASRGGFRGADQRWIEIPYEIKDDQEEIILSREEFNNFIKNLQNVPDEFERFESLLGFHSNEVAQGIRLVLTDPTIIPESERQSVLQSALAQQAVNASDFDSLAFRSNQYRTYLLGPSFAVPLAKFERKLDFQECYSLREGFSNLSFNETKQFMLQELTETQEFKLMLETVFPIKRFMAMTSIFGTGVISGYSRMPFLLVATKNALANTSHLAGLGREARSKLKQFSQEEFFKQITENFTTDGSACLEFPSGFESFFEKFFSELGKLLKIMPSIVLRGIANQLDPAYKEMRQHYINCDISQLNWRGIQPWGTGDYKLTNGLYYDGRSLNPREEPTGLQRKKKGKYVPLVTGLTSDVVRAFTCSPNFTELGIRLGIAMTKLTSYIYSGNQPFIDPAAYFKVPCMDVDYGLWRDKGKYDAGFFGRYGHPLSPFTVLALSTPQLRSDVNLQESSCIDGLPEQDCEELTPEEQGEVIIDFSSEETFDEPVEQSTEQSYDDAPFTPVGDDPLDPGVFSDNIECQAIRVEIRRSINERFTKFNDLTRERQNRQGPMPSAQERLLENRVNELAREISELKEQLRPLRCFGALDESAEVTDHVEVQLIIDGAVHLRKDISIPWKSFYSNEDQINGYYKFIGPDQSSAYNQFGT